VQVRPVVNGPQIMEMRQVVRTVPVAPHVQEYVVKLTLATHPEGRENLLASKYIRYGSSPRGAQTLILGGKVRALLAGRFNVSLEDIRALLLPALRHRIILNFEAQADGRTTDDLLEEIAGKIS
jgi:MoxR-like ATPase